MMWGQKVHDCDLAGHQFEARYDYQGPALNSKIRAADAAEATEFLRAAGKQTYVHDICVKCGKIVKR